MAYCPELQHAVTEAAGFVDVRAEHVTSIFNQAAPADVAEFIQKCTVGGANPYAR